VAALAEQANALMVSNKAKTDEANALDARIAKAKAQIEKLLG
jgi:hypothetical protein